MNCLAEPSLGFMPEVDPSEELRRGRWQALALGLQAALNFRERGFDIGNTKGSLEQFDSGLGEVEEILYSDENPSTYLCSLLKPDADPFTIALYTNIVHYVTSGVPEEELKRYDQEDLMRWVWNLSKDCRRVVKRILDNEPIPHPERERYLGFAESLEYPAHMQRLWR